MREMGILDRLQGEEGVVKVFGYSFKRDVEEMEFSLKIIMECALGNLKDLIVRRGGVHLTSN
jgi:hypothetical protein